MNKREQRIANILTLFTDQRVIGSSSDSNILYYSDVDLDEKNIFKNDADAYNHVLKMFRSKYREVGKLSNVFITDFKCGVLPGGIPIRWNLRAIKLGTQIIEDKFNIN